jgi:hypothetical protein
MHDAGGCKLRTMWLYLGILMTCSGIGTGFGIFLILLYFWDDIKKSLKENKVENSYQREPENQESAKFIDPRYYDKDTAEEMR